MKEKNNSKKYSKLFLLGVFIVSLTGLILLRTVFTTAQSEPASVKMKESVALAERWFDVIKTEKAKAGIESDAVSNVANRFMLGNDYSEITTTLGSLEAKELSSNPEFAALFTKLLLKENIGAGSKIGMSISGSFPSLEIAMLAALQTLNADVMLFSSLGASSYGANQTEATWIDLENWLIEYGGLKFKTNLLTFGAENDNGGGLTEEGMEAIEKASSRNKRQLYVPASLSESINTKMNLLNNYGPVLYINIGGNQASMGSCVHSVTIPNGLNKAYKICDDDDRGLLARMSENGTDFLHILNIKDLAFKNGIPLEPGENYGSNEELYKSSETNRPAAVIMLFVLVLLLYVYARNFR